MAEHFIDYISHDGDTYTDENGDEISTEDGVNAPKMHPVDRQWGHDMYSAEQPAGPEVDIPGAEEIPELKPVAGNVPLQHRISMSHRRRGMAAIAKIRRDNGWDTATNQIDTHNN